MDSDLIEPRKCLEGDDYPVSKDDPASTARSSGSPNELVERFRSLSEGGEYTDPDGVQRALKNA